MDIVKVCIALGNETRYKIVKSLKEQSIKTCCDRIEYDENGVSVGDVVKAIGLAQSTISKHLSILEDAEVIKKEKRGLWSCYFINKDTIEFFKEQLSKDLI